MKRIRKALPVIILACFILVVASKVYSHCQVPCGIYDDRARVKMISENILTIEKANKNIIDLSRSHEKNYNQITRWINTKEKHADAISEIVSYYFLAQRLKPVLSENNDSVKEPSEYKKYIKQLITLHEMIYYSMKAKQQTEPVNTQTLVSLLAEFDQAYFENPDD